MAGWIQKIRSRLVETSKDIGNNIRKVFSFNKPNKAIIKEVEDILISNDLGVEFSSKIVTELCKKSFDGEISENMVIDEVKKEIVNILTPYMQSLIIPETQIPYVIVFSGVNGSGKTTSLAKIAYKLQKEGKKVLIAPCDSFRAAAKEQLEIWATKANCNIAQNINFPDPATIAYKALEQATSENYDVLLIDTAGRMANKANLMNELSKVLRVLQKFSPSYPNLHLSVIDSTIGQAALKQIKSFKDSTRVNGIILTKLDGTSKAGVLVPITQKYMLPIYYVGVGEKIDDLYSFSALDFANALIVRS